MSVAPSVTCPHCEKRFKGRPELIGKKIKCPACSEPFVVPAEETGIQAKKPAAAPSKPAAKPVPAAAVPHHAPGAGSMAQEGVYGIATADLQVRCPNCAKPMLKDDAVVCVYCGYNTLTREHGKTKKVYAVTHQEHFIYLLPGLSCAALMVAIFIGLLVYNILMPIWFFGSPKIEWIVHESLRMWTATALVALMWGLGMFAFKSLVMAPRPQEIEKE